MASGMGHAGALMQARLGALVRRHFSVLLRRHRLRRRHPGARTSASGPSTPMQATAAPGRRPLDFAHGHLLRIGHAPASAPAVAEITAQPCARASTRILAAQSPPRPRRPLGVASGPSLTACQRSPFTAVGPVPPRQPPPPPPPFNPQLPVRHQSKEHRRGSSRPWLDSLP